MDRRRSALAPLHFQNDIRLGSGLMAPDDPAAPARFAAAADRTAALVRAGAAALVLTGITTHRAVESTARKAAQRGPELRVVVDGAASVSRAAHEDTPGHLSFIGRVEPAQALIEALG